MSENVVELSNKNNLLATGSFTARSLIFLWSFTENQRFVFIFLPPCARLLCLREVWHAWWWRGAAVHWTLSVLFCHALSLVAVCWQQAVLEACSLGAMFPPCHMVSFPNAKPCLLCYPAQLCDRTCLLNLQHVPVLCIITVLRNKCHMKFKKCFLSFFSSL